MKKIKIYVVTYNAPDRLESCLNSIIKSDVIKSDYQVFIINNFSRIYLDRKYDSFNIKILNNETRPDFSCGHLSRNWNQAIINGFVDLKKPDCDIVLTIQDDVEVHDEFFKNLVNYHNKFNFISVGTGDDFMSFTPEAIINVGLFDERFCNIGYQHDEYYMRHVAFNREKCSINDFYHNCLHNQIYASRDIALKDWSKDDRLQDKYIYYNGYNDLIKFKTCGYLNGDEGHMASLRYHSLASEFMRSKWQFNNTDVLNMYARSACEEESLRVKIYDEYGFFNRGVGKSAYKPFTSGPFDDWIGDPSGNFANILSEPNGFACLNPQPVFYPYFELDIKSRIKIGYSY